MNKNVKQLIHNVSIHNGLPINLYVCTYVWYVSTFMYDKNLIMKFLLTYFCSNLKYCLWIYVSKYMSV